MRFGVLGPLEVWTDDGTPVTIPEAKVRLLLADLLSHDGRPVPVDRLAEDLWGSQPPNDPAAVLRTKVSLLRRALQVAEPGGRDLVVWQAPGYALRIDADALDVSRFGALTGRARARADAPARAALLTDALSLWRGRAFADFADEGFLRGRITRLEEERLTAVEELAEVELELGRHHHLAGELAEQVSRHPLRERLRASHMRALYLAGRQSEALDSYHDLRLRLADELGVDPSPDLVAMHQAILEHDPALDAPTPRAGANLPVPLTELIGRDEALVRLRRTVSAWRLTTLTGPGGVGKTRLALAAGGQLTSTFPDGVWLVELASLDHPARTDARATPADVATLIAAALGMADATVPGAQGRPIPIVDRVVAAIRERRMLLLLDNCEHVIGPTAELAERLLTSAPEVRILATSREPLGISGEQVQVVGPLDEADAVRLFADRAAASAGLDAQDAETVALICRQLDGLPLALELAAARVRSLGVREVASRLDARFRLLTTGRRDAPARQQTLRAVIDWSWELLTEQERVVLCALALHPGGCTLEAAEAVCATDDVLDPLGRLVDRSLVVAADGPTGYRYRLAHSVAAYCVERLAESGELAGARQRHDDYYVRLAEQADVQLRGSGQRHWLRRLDAETANLRGTLDGAVSRHDRVLARRLAIALAWYWFLRGRLEEAHQALSPDAAGVPVWCSAFALMIGRGASVVEVDDPMEQWILGTSLFGVGDLRRSADLVGEALTSFRARGDGWGVAASLNTLAWHAMAQGDHATAGTHAQESLAAFDELGDEWGQMVAMESLGAVAEATARYECAATFFRRSLGVAERLALGAEIPFKLCGLADVHLATGEHDQAERLYERARLLAAEQSMWLAETYALIGLGRVARRTGRLDTAEAHLSLVLDWHRRHGYEPQVAAATMTELGLVAGLRGDTEQALASHEEACRTARASGDPRTIAQALEGLAGALALMDRHPTAARLLGTAAAARTSAGTPLPPADRPRVHETTAAVRTALGEAAYTTEFTIGVATQ